MKKLQKAAYMLMGALVAVCLMTAVPAIAATSAKQITAYYRDIKIVVDGAKIDPKDGNGKAIEPFIVDGTTYLPVSAVAKALGKTADWDGGTSTVYIGAKPGAVTYLPDVVPAYDSKCYRVFSAKGNGDKVNIAGQPYNNAIAFYLHGFNGASNGYALYNLNGEYKTLTGLVGHVDGGYKRATTIKFFCDGELKYEIDCTSEMMPKPISLDISGVLQLKIAITDGYETHYAIANLAVSK